MSAPALTDGMIDGGRFCPRRLDNPASIERFPGPDVWETGRWYPKGSAELAQYLAERGPSTATMIYGEHDRQWPPESGAPARTCSYCGGVHPNDALRLLEQGWHLDRTGKSYKVYLEPPHGFQLIPPVKLYTPHCTQEDLDLLNEALRANRRTT